MGFPENAVVVPAKAGTHNPDVAQEQAVRSKSGSI